MSTSSQPYRLLEREICTAVIQGSLCATCEHLVEASNWFTSDITLDLGTVAHQPTVLKLKSSADAGCHLCSLFYGSIMLAPLDCLPNTYLFRGGPLEAEVHRHESDNNKPFSIRLVDSSNRQGFTMELQGHIEHQAVFQKDQQEVSAKSTRAFSSTASSQSTGIARDWLSRCLLHHELCQEHSADDRIVPTRLIRINEAPSSIQLVLNNDCGVKYLILSYCWGLPKENELKLTRENVDSLLKMLHFADLPKTIQDAILVTKKLGYTYLWIDRLCIFQGDQPDWEYEGARMGDYYLNTECCIAALNSVDSHQGLFIQRNPLLMQPLVLNSPSVKLRIEANVGGIQGDYPRLFRGPEYALSKRAWTLQVRLLSPRTLYYGSLMIYWECLTMCCKESLPTTQLDLAFTKELRKFGSCSAGVMDGLWQPPEAGTEMENFEQRWANLVQFYTKCHMTYASDRLVAISGMMNTMSQRTHLNFVYGLLRIQLATELLWWQWVDCKGEEMIVPERNANAPTWSWGSVKGRIEPFRCNRWLGPSRLPWQIEADVSIIEGESETLVGYKSDDKHSKICRVEFTTPLLEATIVRRLDLRHYNWNIQAVASTGPNSFLKLSVQMWADEPMCEGKIVWLCQTGITC